MKNELNKGTRLVKESEREAGGKNKRVLRGRVRF